MGTGEMRIIDAHMHLFPDAPFVRGLCEAVGHENSVAHLRESYARLGMRHGVVMGNHSLDPAYHSYPGDLFHYCVGLDSSIAASEEARAADLPDVVETHLRRESCCGVKLYPGYNREPLTSPFYAPVYALAARYDKPVAVHMGLTASANAHLKYCHPLALDEVAADHPRTRFVMCHFGNPFLDAAAAVTAKNPNVAADLSGLLEGRLDWERFSTEQAGYLLLLKSWLAAVDDWTRFMYGTDWPAVNLEEYIGFIRHVVPEKHWDTVFFANANRIYGLGLS